MNQRIEVAPVDPDANYRAREQARERVSWPINLAATGVEYRSHGHALVIGDSLALGQVLARHAVAGSALASLTLVTTDEPDDALLEQVAAQTAGEPRTASVDAANGRPGAATAATASPALALQPLSMSRLSKLRLAGYLGRFSATLDTGDGPLNLAKALIGRDHFDAVLDLADPPRLELELPPPGYLRPALSREAVIEALGELTGDFEKPRYFQIQSAVCAHSTRGLSGCTRCLDVCPADAISSRPGRIDATIEIDPHRCHGVGSCSSACPTGAIEFRQPHSHHQQDALVAWLAAYHDAGGRQAVVRFVQADPGAAPGQSPATAGHVIDVPLEELGAAGADQWLTALAAGAAEVRLQRHTEMPATLQSVLEQQLSEARALLSALGHDPRRIAWLDIDDSHGRDALPRFSALVDTPVDLHAPARGAGEQIAELPTPGTSTKTGAQQLGKPNAHGAAQDDGKRHRFNRVLDHLALQGELDGHRHGLGPNTAFGGLRIDAGACTLCMGCVASCPTSALEAGGSLPRLTFREADCVQCGLCEKACPEQAITLLPGFLASPERSTRRVCHEDSPFACISCGKAFANTGTIAAIKTKLADHPYFAGEAAARLEMCEDCRVKDVWQALAKDPESQLKV
ncbi:4Fe-4S binding protein [Halomonas sp. V046]|uniref:4Fe-4S binding protein n=1 Tax=Halomonas sp. V046 TaxID=3459611 RepID=UPI004043CEC4